MGLPEHAPRVRKAVKALVNEHVAVSVQQDDAHLRYNITLLVPVEPIDLTDVEDRNDTQLLAYLKPRIRQALLQARGDALLD